MQTCKLELVSSKEEELSGVDRLTIDGEVLLTVNGLLTGL